MAGTVSGGKLAAQKNLAVDPDWYRNIGAKGGSVKGIKKGFALSGKASEAGSRGGKTSRRGPTIRVEWKGEEVSLSAVAKDLGMPYRKVYRYYVEGKLNELQAK